MDLAGFELYMTRAGLAKSTTRNYLDLIKVVSREVDSFDEKTIDVFLAGKIHSLSNAGVNKYVKVIRKYCGFKEIEWGKRVKELREYRKPRVLITDAEIEDFVNLDPEDGDNPDSHRKFTIFWKLLAYSGARPKEILSLTTNDFDFVNNVFFIQTSKTGDGRTIPISTPIINDVKEYLDILKTSLLFPSPCNTLNVISHASVLKNFYKRKKRLGINRDIKPYSLRHSYITRLADEDVNIFALMDLAGHKKASTTQRYYHGSIKAMRRAIEKDPLMQRSMKPWTIILKFVEIFNDFFRSDSRIQKIVEIDEETQEVTIRLKVKEDPESKTP